MGVRVSSEFRRFIIERRITRIAADRRLVLKEVRGAESDSKDAKDSFRRGRFKWAIIQGYYSMFHAARALIFSKGYREKSHYALLVALRELFSKQLEIGLLEGLESAMSLREEADYGLVFSEEGAQEVLKSAEAFVKRAKEILGIRG